MRVVLDLFTAEPPRVLEPSDFRRLHLECRAPAPDVTALDERLRSADVGSADGEHVRLSVAWLRQAAAQPDPDWTQGFDAMLGYAAGQGWIDATGETVRAHVEWLEGAVATRDR